MIKEVLPENATPETAELNQDGFLLILKQIEEILKSDKTNFGKVFAIEEITKWDIIANIPIPNVQGHSD